MERVEWLPGRRALSRTAGRPRIRILTRALGLLLPLLPYYPITLLPSCQDERVRKACFEGDCQSGEGVLVYYRIIYRGQFKDGKPAGQGTMQWSEGKIYKGEWSDGKPAGQGTMHFKDGRTYAGQWQEGRYHGKGVMKYPDGRIYSGDWYKGKKHGYGELIFSDGHKLKGRFQNDMYDP